jgi:hypothetical protein
MPVETDPALEHPYSLKIDPEFSPDSTILRIFFEEYVPIPKRRLLEKILLDGAQELIAKDNNPSHYMDEQFKWIIRTCGASKVEAYVDFGWVDQEEAILHIRRLLTPLHDFQPPISLVKVTM